ncbi:L-amino acid ABC transporter (Glu/Asp/His/...), permease protein 1 AapQ [hydrothermal vent metagenome]|uniref:L-amino acid ABC transporter (Glu/Asp/His/...), permease protein 1 AapQ n=1 Tax=hydrothermal vent metagenome TaxID=652676 RepID=A0A3B0UL05_9ZZZZ
MASKDDSANKTIPASNDTSGNVSLIYNPKIRSWFYQAVLLGGVAWFFVYIWGNLTANMARQNIRTGFGFLDNIASFDIGFTLVPYDRSSTFADALLVGFLNTMLVSVIGIIIATLLGFTVGIARLSSNWIIARLATIYVETLRNIPLLLQMFFWYFGVLSLLPNVKQSLELPLYSIFNKRGLVTPAPLFSANFYLVVIALFIAIIAAVFVTKWANRRQDETGVRPHSGLINLALLIGLPAIVWIIAGASLEFRVPVLRGFNYKGGIHIPPEFIAVLWALILYTATFIAEIVRAGILAVPRGQTEAAQSLGLKESDLLRKVIIPQAMRVIVPPLTSQYLNLTKNSSLAVAVGYPDLVSVFMGTTLNQTGQAVEVVAITMIIYLSLSLSTSAFMNWFNARIALSER